MLATKTLLTDVGEAKAATLETYCYRSQCIDSGETIISVERDQVFFCAEQIGCC